MMDQATLIRMANAIARNLAAQGEEAATAIAAKHILDFWDPHMKAAIPLLDRASLLPIAAAALDRVSAQLSTRQELSS